MNAVPYPLFEHRWPEGEFRMFQLGFVVPDLVVAAAHWAQVFGVGPFHVMPRARSTCRYRGVDAAIDIQIAVAQAGPVQIELIQDYTDGPSVFRDMESRHDASRFGLHQLSTLTRDYDGKIAHYTDNGYEIACELTTPGQRVAFIDTVGEYGFFTEIVEEKPSFQANLAKISATCADWDGRDPVRILSRAGYTTPESSNPESSNPEPSNDR